MCNPVESKTNSTNSPKSARKRRTKTRRPKFLSLNLKLSPENSKSSGDETHNNRRHQLNLFPLNPEIIIEEKDTHDENVAYLLNSDGGNSLAGVLAGVSSEQDSLSPAGMYSYQEMDEGESSLVRTAMRSKDRDVGEEKWVCYSEVVEKKEEEVSSSPAAAIRRRTVDPGFLLKLDYQEILSAWNDKGCFFVGGESSQTVPDFHDDDFLQHDFIDGWGNAANVWRVPEEGSKKEGWNSGQREASVLRYKEKRQNRLFAKRIRYEVRKLNAEKRPRMKGRFVKRN